MDLTKSEDLGLVHLLLDAQLMLYESDASSLLDHKSSTRRFFNCCTECQDTMVSKQRSLSIANNRKYFICQFVSSKAAVFCARYIPPDRLCHFCKNNWNSQTSRSEPSCSGGMGVGNRTDIWAKIH